jgi:phage/plasmid-like protein (TIGR03299 family)
MSRETSKWLNTLTLIGYVLKRGHAWHYRASDQGEEPNHYGGAIPVADVLRRLFNFQFAEGDVTTSYLTTIEDFENPGQKVQVPIDLHDSSRKTIIRPRGAFGADDSGEILYIPKIGFKVHDYEQWLIRNVETLLDDDADNVGIASAGLLKGGAVAWVQFELPDNRQVEGFEYRPFITAATSVDGSLSSTYLTGADAVVCDNTLDGALIGAAARVKIRHSSNSLGRAGEVRERLGLQIAQVGDEFDAFLKDLIATPVTPKQFGQMLDLQVPVPEEKGRGLTIALNTREAIASLYKSDERCAPWQGTGLGVLQAFNTWTHHVQGARGSSRVQRNMLKAVTGQFGKDDADVLSSLNKVLAAAV